MSLTEMIQISIIMTAIVLYWWFLAVALMLAITNFMGERCLMKLDRKIGKIRTQGVH